MEQTIKIKQFLDSSGKIMGLPQKQKSRRALLEYLAEKFEPGCTYSEREVNSICNQWIPLGITSSCDGSSSITAFCAANGMAPATGKRRPPDMKRRLIMNREFHPIDRNAWSRAPYFYYFTKMLPTGYSLTVEVDITNAYHTVKRVGKKFFPAYLYLASRLISRQKEFCIAEQDGQLGYYEVLHPSYACFHEDDKTMSSLWTEYDSDFETFYSNYMEDQRQYAGNHGIVAKTNLPDNNFMVGMLLWTQFTSYTPVPYGSVSNYFPVLQAGRFFDKGDRKMMPLSITVHHAVADGYHVGLFLQRFQEGMLHTEEWMEAK